LGAKRTRPVPRHLICTRPTNITCMKCHRPVLYAIVYGEHVRMDPTHLSLKGEALALISGASTYQTGDTRDGAVRLRSVEMISRGLPATAYIHPSHQCGMNWQDYSDGRSAAAPVLFSGAAPPF